MKASIRVLTSVFYPSTTHLYTKKIIMATWDQPWTQSRPLMLVSHISHARDNRVESPPFMTLQEMVIYFTSGVSTPTLPDRYIYLFKNGVGIINFGGRFSTIKVKILQLIVNMKQLCKCARVLQGIMTFCLLCLRVAEFTKWSTMG